MILLLLMSLTLTNIYDIYFHISIGHVAHMLGIKYNYIYDTNNRSYLRFLICIVCRFDYNIIIYFV